MGNSLSDVPTNFDEYINEKMKHYPLMTVSVYKDGELRGTFEAPNGFDFLLILIHVNKYFKCVFVLDVLEDLCENRITVTECIEDYLHDIISDDIFPPECELYDLDRDSHHIDHVIYRYVIRGNVNTIDLNELLLSSLRQQINVVYNIGNTYQIIITSIYEVCKEPTYRNMLSLFMLNNDIIQLLPGSLISTIDL
jgi:hypothetical protein